MSKSWLILSPPLESIIKLFTIIFHFTRLIRFLNEIKVIRLWHVIISSKLVVIMARPIKLFCFNQKLFQKIGILRLQSNQNNSFNLKKWLFLFSVIQLSIVFGGFFLFKANTLDERGLTFYVGLSAICFTFYYISSILQIDNILKLIENFEELIGNSKFVSI